MFLIRWLNPILNDYTLIFFFTFFFHKIIWNINKDDSKQLDEYICVLQYYVLLYIIYIINDYLERGLHSLN